MDATGFPTRFHRKKALQQFRKAKFAAKQAAKVASVNPERPGFIEKDEDEVVTQEIIRQNVDLGSASKITLETEGKFYILVDGIMTNRYLAICGKRGHLAAFDWMTKRLLFEINVNEECRDVKFLHQETFISVAQKGYTYVYDNQGIELHCLKRMAGIRRLEFLPYHFILVAMADNGFMYYLDASIGEIVASYPTYMGSLSVACQNPSNASILTGHPSGTVSVWIPTEKTPVVKMLCHKSGVKSIAVNRTGQYLATCGLDRYLKIWDLRSTHNCLAEITLATPAVAMDFSQTGLLALGSSITVQVLKDPATSTEVAFQAAAQQHVDVEVGLVHRRVLRSAYLTHNCRRPVHSVAFCPFEDVLGVATAGGFHSLLCPGAGEPNFDALEENPFANRRYRQEREVRRLLDKIPYTMISVDSMLNKVRRQDIEEEWNKKCKALLGEIPKVPMPKVNRNKMKGRSKAQNIEKRKQVLRFNRKQFEVSTLMREKAARRDKEKVAAAEMGNLPSDALVAKRRMKKRTNSALDVLIPKKH
ncbi:WD repeat-containing protein 46 [Echinococcus granulosus]|uniref:WD repeat-containing protein 46 n=1 Tax=Echinococcus granulosus TaxID=6210 RepID=W6UCN8_ECHGR|nr:WD repeat-containing protein 46 [Echinococcus granulosus]EUB56047.1 WD repeat-containing protein 46 [Echinococcus granulosus]